MAEYRGKSVVVSGGAGFVGAHLIARLLALGADVTTVLRPSTKTWRFDALEIAPRVLRCDLEDKAGLIDGVAPLKPEYIFHMAAERDLGMLALADAEARSACPAVNLMEAGHSDRLTRFVSVGSSLEITDVTAGMPGSLNGKAKLRELQGLRALAADTGTPYSPTRTHYVYGPLQSTNKLIPVAIRAAQDGQTLALTGPGIRKRFVFVLDLVAGLLQVPDVPPKPDDVLLISSSQQVSSLEMVELISKVTGKPIRTKPNEYTPRAFDRDDWDLSQAGTPLPNWCPQTSLEDGLRACIDWQARAYV